MALIPNKVERVFIRQFSKKYSRVIGCVDSCSIVVRVSFYPSPGIPKRFILLNVMNRVQGACTA